MGDPKTLSIQDIANINAAVASVGDNEAVSATIGYRLGRLGDYTERIVRTFQREREKTLSSFRQRTAKMTEAEKGVENDKLAERLNELAEQTEEINIPELKYSDFVASTDMKVGSKEYKAGQLLVPIKFFSLMGELIIDDQKLSPEQKKKEVKKTK